MNQQEKTIIKNLNKIGVDTRYISLYDDTIYINNLKFSKFSRKKEEKLHTIYPQIKVIRSSLFQKICIKTSRTLKNQIKPKDEIYMPKTNKPEDILSYIILEPYRRKYGIKITHTKKENIKNTNTKYLDQFINNYFTQMINAKKIEEKKEENTIYPLEQIPYEWIINWIKTTDLNYEEDELPIDDEIIKLNKFIEKKIPQYKQSIKQSVKNLEN